MSQQQLRTLLAEHVNDLGEQIAESISDAQLPSYSLFGREQLIKMGTAAMQAFSRDLSEGAQHHFASYWETVAKERAPQGTQIEDLFQAVLLSESLLKRFVVDHFGNDATLHNWFQEQMHSIIYSGLVVLARVFVAARERVIHAQAAQIRDISTPIMPLHEGILALPLVGALDSYRASQVLETLLSGISEHQAEVVIVDITGVPVVDTGVANHLLQAARAARLLGAQVVLVGISAEIAQTVTQLGADLSGITIRSNLQAGVEHALAQQGLHITAA